ncbi:hypothetical protein ACVRWB_03665 [Streptococcus troglodytae]|uniref:Uncharacterized protein n=1 Tax=Streptococcus troglodytae TaxID=1111760 RepID=A0A1L7LKM7_9STRE|nr:hypothetical protein [Streptococcus troglodytae]BAQ24731.1 putative uncharacterized protein [Streptococcus troglodytae]
MSRLITNLVGQKVVVQLEDDLGNSKWTIIDTDEEWLHLSQTNRKGSEINKYVHVDDVKSIQTIAPK